MRHIVLDVDVKGEHSVKKYYGDCALGVFVKPPLLEVLAQRLTARNTDSASSISSRLYKASFELSFADQFDAVVVNEHLADAIAQAEALVDGFLGGPRPLAAASTPDLQGASAAEADKTAG